MFAIIPAAGSGQRMGGGPGAKSKLYLELNSTPTVLEVTVRGLLDSETCSGFVVAVRKQDMSMAREALQRLPQFNSGTLPLHIIEGGSTRQKSVALALQCVPPDCENVLVHDGARPLCSTDLFRRVASEGKASGAAIAALQVKPTIKECADGMVIRTLTRGRLWETQTPQVFGTEILRRAHRQAEAEAFQANDDSELVERIGQAVRIVSGEEANIKITTPFDLKLAELLTRIA